MIEKDSIIGVQNNKRVALAKNDITEIKKNKTGATIALIAGSAALVVVAYAATIPAQLLNENFGAK